jgi:hypothetical protein
MNESQYCHVCGSPLNCKSCSSRLAKDAKFCSSCGVAVNSTQEKENGTNTLKYRKTNDEVFCEVALTDAVAKDGITTLIKSITNSDIYPTIKVGENKVTSIGIAEDISHDYYPSTAENVLNVSDEDAQKNKIINSNSTVDFPHIDDLVIHLQCLEQEWLAIFAFYEAEYGRQTFTQEKVKTAYYRLRKTDSRVSNFGYNWGKFFKEYASTVSSGFFKLRADKIDSIVALIHRANNPSEGVSNSRNIQSVRKTKVSKGSKTSPKAVPVHDFNIDAGPDKDSLEDFYNGKNVHTTAERILVISYYVIKCNKQEYFTDGNIEFAYKVLGLERIAHLRQTISNTKNKHSWFKMTNEGWVLERLGEIYVDKL